MPVPARVHVWLIATPPGAPSAEQLALLDAHECERAVRFQFARDHDRYVVAHGWLRTVLGRFTGMAPDRLDIVQAPFEKPFLRATEKMPMAPFFNLSHTEGFVAIAVSNDCEVGVDVERMRPWTELASLARNVLHADEAQALAGLSADDRASAFFALWCAKEAYTKATGLGLGHAFDSIGTGIETARHDWQDGRRLTVAGCPSASLRVSTVPASHAVAVAALAPALDAVLHVIRADAGERLGHYRPFARSPSER